MLVNISFMTERYIGWQNDQSYKGILEGYKLNTLNEVLQAILEAAVDSRDPHNRAGKLAKNLGLNSSFVLNGIRAIQAVELSHSFTSGANSRMK
jgi:hypothetical protein